MIKRLRRNFVISAMAAVIVVLAVIVAAINITNYINSDNEADGLLELLTENNGSFAPPDRMSEPPDLKPDGDEPPAKPDGFDRKERRFGRAAMTAETPYETRFFTVVLKADCEPYSVNTGQIAAVSAEDAISMAKRLQSSGKTSGYESVYKYFASENENGTLYVFLDRSRALRSVREFMVTSLLVAAGACIAILILVFIFSGLMIKPVAESYEKQKRFITNAGHELKTPLAVINSCTEVIELEQGESKWTKGISTQTERLAGLTNELVALARMDEGAAQLTFEEFSLSETVGEVLDPFQLMAEHKGLRLDAEIEENVTFRGDRNAMARLCSILADNAVKYTPDGGSIRFKLQKKGRRVIISTENTAEHVTKGAHPELFDRFTRGDTSHSSDISGYGIGLSMAQSIVSAHGGKVEALSKDGKSLTITARL